MVPFPDRGLHPPNRNDATVAMVDYCNILCTSRFLHHDEVGPSAACSSLRHPNLCAVTLTYAQMNEIGSGGGEAVLAPNRGGGEPHSSVEGILPADSIKESTRGTIKIGPEQATSHGPSAPHARPTAFSTTRPSYHTCHAHWRDRWHAPCFAGGGSQGGR